MKKIQILFAAAAMFAVADLSAQTVNDVNAKYNEAVALIQAKNYEASIPVLEQVVEMGFNAGPDASATIQQAQKLIPTCYFQYGLSLCKTGKLEEAIPVLENAIQYAELFQDVKVLNNSRKLISQTYTLLGADAFNDKDWAKAIDVFSKGYAANPTDTDLALYLAESYSESGDLENGLKTYHDIVNLEARHSRYEEPAAKAREKIAYYQTLRAMKAAEEGKTDDVYAYVDDILSVDPDNAAAQMLRVQTANNAQQWNRVIEWGDAAATAQTDPDMASSIYFMLGAAYQNTENKDAAIANYSKVTSGDHAAAARQQIELLNK